MMTCVEDGEGGSHLNFNLARSACFLTNCPVRPALHKIALAGTLAGQLEIVKPNLLVVYGQFAIHAV